MDESVSEPRASTPMLPDTTYVEQASLSLSLGLGDDTKEELLAVGDVLPQHDCNFEILFEDSCTTASLCSFNWSGSIAAWDSNHSSQHPSRASSVDSADFASHDSESPERRRTTKQENIPNLGDVVQGVRSRVGVLSDSNSEPGSVDPSGITPRRAFDLRHTPRFNKLQVEQSQAWVSGTGDPLLTSFYNGTARWLFLSGKKSCGRPIRLPGE